MGRVAAAYGVHGWIKVQPFTSELDVLLDYPTWWLSEPGGGNERPHRVLDARRHSGFLIAKLEGIASREQAAALRGWEVVVPRDALPETNDDEVYVGDLAGCTAVTRQGRPLGVVIEVRDNGAQPILRVVDAGKNECLIPFVPAYVLAVDLEAKRIDVDWLEDY